MTNYVKHDIIILLPSLELVVGGNFMENLTRSQEHLSDMDTLANFFIGMTLVPTFKEFRTDYPKANNWNITIITYLANRSFKVISSTDIAPRDSTSLALPDHIRLNILGNTLTPLLDRTCQILKDKIDTYHILVDDWDSNIPLLRKTHVYVFTMYNN